jgi:hypothetical protein
MLRSSLSHILKNEHGRPRCHSWQILQILRAREQHYQHESRLPKPSADAARTLKLCFLCRQIPAGAGAGFDVI